MKRITTREYESNPAHYLQQSKKNQIEVMDGENVVAVLGWGRLPPVKDVDLSSLKEGPRNTTWFD